MQIKIFKPVLCTAVAVMVMAGSALAQHTKAKPQKPAKPQKHAKGHIISGGEDFDFDLNLNMDDLKVDLGDLKTNVSVNLNGLEKTLTTSLEGLGETISNAVTSATSNLNVNLGHLDVDMDDDDIDVDINDNTTVNAPSNHLSDKEYKEKIANGQLTERVKNYSKTYSVDANDLLQISNSFGKVTVNTWARKEFKVDVQMKFAAEDEDDVNNWINGTSINDSKVGSTVSFRTNIYNGGNKRHNGNQKMEINYTVYMPAGNPVDIKNTFGSVVLPDLSGKAILRVSYGSLNAQQLLSGDNDVKVSFGDANISNFNGGRLNVSYGKLKAGTVNNVDADISFAGFSAERLKNSANFDIKYGDGFNVGTIDKSVRNLIIKASFTKIKLDFNEAENFNFDVTTKMGDFNYNDDNVKVTSKSPADDERGWSSIKSYKGYIGKNNSDGKISISASFTNVRFN